MLLGILQSDSKTISSFSLEGYIPSTVLLTWQKSFSLDRTAESAVFSMKNRQSSQGRVQKELIMLKNQFITGFFKLKSFKLSLNSFATVPIELQKGFQTFLSRDHFLNLLRFSQLTCSTDWSLASGQLLCNDNC